MKRSQIKRRTELKRGQPLKRTPLKPVSAKRRKLMAEVKPFRDKYLASKFLCEACLKKRSQEVHEICRGPHREKALDKEYAVLALCRTCHEAMGSHCEWPVSKQLALKVLRSPAMFGLNFDVVNELRGYSATEFTADDVFNHLALAKE